MDDFEKMFNDEKTDVEQEVKPDYEKDWKDTAREWKDWFIGLWEWKKVPLTILFSAILLVGAVLMFQSIYSFTKNIIIAVLSVAFTEAGIVAWEFANERVKNTVNQLKRSKFMRNLHIGSSVLLLITNMAIETATNTLSIKIDGAIWIVFGAVGIMSFMDIWNYFYFRDNDKELSDRRKHEEKLNEIRNKRTKARLEALEKAEEFRNKAEVEYWEEHSEEYASVTGRIEAEKRLKERFSLTEEQVEKYFSNSKNTEYNDDENNTEENSSGKRPYKKTGQYSKKNQLTPPQEKPEPFPIGETQPQQVVDEEKMRKMQETKIFN